MTTAASAELPMRLQRRRANSVKVECPSQEITEIVLTCHSWLVPANRSPRLARRGARPSTPLLQEHSIHLPVPSEGEGQYPFRYPHAPQSALLPSARMQGNKTCGGEPDSPVPASPSQRLKAPLRPHSDPCRGLAQSDESLRRAVEPSVREQRGRCRTLSARRGRCVGARAKCASRRRASPSSRRSKRRKESYSRK